MQKCMKYEGMTCIKTYLLGLKYIFVKRNVVVLRILQTDSLQIKTEENWQTRSYIVHCYWLSINDIFAQKYVYGYMGE